MKNFLWRLKCARQAYNLADFIHHDQQLVIDRELRAVGKSGDQDWRHRSPEDDGGAY
jgi:hypothetical protein